VRSKADNSQLNLPHCTISGKNNDKKLKNKNEKSISQQFDDDTILHSSRWRLKTDWGITILISAE